MKRRLSHCLHIALLSLHNLSVVNKYIFKIKNKKFNCCFKHSSTVMANWNNQFMLDLYLYDYFKKKNMHETAENFLKEINFPFDPTTVSPAIDSQEGFLNEWWQLCNDMYREQQLRAHYQGEGSSSTMPVEQMMGASQQVDPSLLYMMNEQTISHMLAATGLNSKYNAMVSMNPFTGVEIIPDAISSSSPQPDLLATTLAPNLPGSLANLTGQEVGSSVLAASRKNDIASNEETEPTPLGFANNVLNPIWVAENNLEEQWDESQSAQSDGESVNKSDLQDGNCSLHGDVDATSEASLTKYKSRDDDSKSSSSNANGNKEDADSSSNKLPECATTPDNLIVNQVVEAKKEGFGLDK
ncbi:hypothetical protein ACOSP7_025038 [Xanthoceras sorbifolium]